ncbi:class I SAM-dependent RNA methyltransferase [Paenibacillus sp. IB182496]|uniref:Class I SAM-dependent RNA methyltransferase n=1 Tax=Paenibacillus sabuli TaxID=2772509 RepID=A0A927GST9_9BACL|nr:class I SAM-dependent RNA methyltransferase [Paenibacillus sabuli]MBD2846017.1 class I SAM-dependent RNA methyltransferase [Paenibacillus sabuli]
MATDLTLIATCPMGLEAIVARELAALGYADTRTDNGRVSFRGGLLDICRTNLWLRTADRILIHMGSFPAHTFEELFEGTKALDWPAWIPEDGVFPVDGRSHKSQLSSVPACQSIVKKAIVERMKAQYGHEWFPEDGARYAAEVSLLGDIAHLTLDTTGPSLHKRGYRLQSTEAPLKETMAAALVLLSRWRAERPLYDPFCGSGTLPIEAAMIAWNLAPGLRRTFSSEAWPIIGEALWEQAREEAYDAVRDDTPLDIAGSDIDSEAIAIAEAAARKAGLGRELRWEVLPAAKIAPAGRFGCIVTNPPYGERLGNDREAEAAIRQLSASAGRLGDWSVFAISPDKSFERVYGRPADKRRKLYNGRIECQFYQFFGPLPPRPPKQSAAGEPS